VAYQEYAVGGHLVDEQDVTTKLDDLFGVLRAQALPQTESLRRIAEIAQRAKEQKKENKGE
jgi:hypothetical protein